MSLASWLITVFSKVEVVDRGDGHRHPVTAEAFGGQILVSELFGAFVPDRTGIMTT